MENSQKFSEKIEKENLDGVLQLFFSTVKKENGESYEPCNLNNLHAVVLKLSRFFPSNVAFIAMHTRVLQLY